MRRKHAFLVCKCKATLNGILIKKISEICKFYQLSTAFFGLLECFIFLAKMAPTTFFEFGEGVGAHGSKKKRNQSF